MMLSMPSCRVCGEECKEGSLFEETVNGAPNRWIVFFCEKHVKEVASAYFVRVASPEEIMIMIIMDYACVTENFL